MTAGHPFFRTHNRPNEREGMDEILTPGSVDLHHLKIACRRVSGGPQLGGPSEEDRFPKSYPSAKTARSAWCGHFLRGQRLGIRDGIGHCRTTESSGALLDNIRYCRGRRGKARN